MRRTALDDAYAVMAAIQSVNLAEARKEIDRKRARLVELGWSPDPTSDTAGDLALRIIGDAQAAIARNKQSRATLGGGPPETGATP